ncbi:MAG: hypothetical protein KUG77_11600, partial [Nannocystaceae bacterium]|nr:hypothetical protein [Nannocystaceae bacterium]
EPLRVLIVDDEHLARDRLSRMVTALANYEIVGEAANDMVAPSPTNSPTTPPSPALRSVSTSGESAAANSCSPSRIASAVDSRRRSIHARD